MKTNVNDMKLKASGNRDTTKAEVGAELNHSHINHIKIYGNGVADVLRQAEINGVFAEGTLKIQIDKERCLTVAPDKDNVLQFSIEVNTPTKKPAYPYTLY